MLRHTFLPLIMLLTACGGSGDQTLTQRYALRAQAEAWENRMPSARFPGEGPSCTALIVAFSIRGDGSGLPPAVLAQTVVLSKPGLPPVEINVSQSETGVVTRWVSASDWLSLLGSVDGNPPPGWKNEQALSGVARGCASDNFREGDELLVEVHIVSEGEAATVEAKAKLYAAY